MRTVDVLRLRPTQLFLGDAEVRGKAAEFRRLSPAKLEARQKEHPIAVVISPTGEYFIADGHHRARALWSIGCRRVVVEIEKDYSGTRLGATAFWRELRRRRWAHVSDFDGRSRDPLLLARDITAVGDDPYRSLAWLVQRAGGYRRSRVPFANFRWAEFFRRRRLLGRGYERDFDGAVRKALKAARSKAARRLPGFVADPESFKPGRGGSPRESLRRGSRRAASGK